MGAPKDLDVAWTRSPAAARVREVLVCGVLGAAMDAYTRRTLHGRSGLDGVQGPVVFVANHNSHMDTPAILRALPRRWRRRTAVAAAADYFYGNRRNAIAASLAFGTVPLDRAGGGLGDAAIGHIDAHLAGGGSLLVYAEGSRSQDGAVARLRSGAAVIAARHDAPVVPIFLAGTRDAMPRGRHWMVWRGGRPGRGRHPVEIRFGAPMHPAREGLDPRAVMERVRSFLAEHGADTRGLPENADPGATGQLEAPTSGASPTPVAASDAGRRTDGPASATGAAPAVDASPVYEAAASDDATAARRAAVDLRAREPVGVDDRGHGDAEPVEQERTTAGGRRD